MYALNIHKITSQSVLKNVQLIHLGNFFSQIIPYIDYANRQECLKLFTARAMSSLRTYVTSSSYISLSYRRIFKTILPAQPSLRKHWFEKML